MKRPAPAKRPAPVKRTGVLVILLLLAILAWGALRLQERRRSVWLASAPREELVRYVADHANDPDALLRLGILARTSGDNAEAQRLLQRAINLAPEKVEAWIELSRAQASDGDAVQTLQQVLKQAPDSAAALAELAHRSLQAGDADAARTTVERALRVAPGSADGWRVRGDLLAAARQTPEAEKAYRKAQALHDDPETRLALARLWIPQQRYPEILAICAPIVAAGRSPEVSAEQRARALLYTAGGRLYDPLTPAELAGVQSQLREAEALSDRLTPGERFLPPYFLGESELRAGRPAEAIPLLERSVKLGPQFAASLYSLARAYRLNGNVARADDATARHMRLSRLLSAIDNYSNRLEQRPDDAEAMLRLANELAESGSAENAARLYRRLISEGRFVDLAKRKLQETNRAVPRP